MSNLENNNFSSEEHKRRTQTVCDFVAVTVLTIASYIFASVFDAYEQLYEWTRFLRDTQIDEIFISFYIFAFAMSWFTIRRLREWRAVTYFLKHKLSDEKQLQDKLVEESNFLQILMNNVPDYIYFKDAESRFIRINKAMANVYELSDPKEAIGKTDHDFYPKENADEFYADEQTIIKSGEPMIAKEENSIRPGVPESWASTTKMPILDNDGKIVGIFGISRDITGHKRDEKDALAHLHELNETKSQFVAEVSHELRTPLGIIREFVSLVSDEVAGPLTEKQKECLQSAIKNCDRITELINKMLDLARIEAGKIELNRERADIAQLLKECYEDFLVTCQSRKQELLLEVPNDLPAACYDVESIREVVTNLVGNAQKFTPEGGTITISCQHGGQFLTVCVEDSGIGISPEAQEKIFEPFIQVGRNNGPGAKGTGLGLSITKELVKMNGGYISVDSTPGEGSRFSFTLPVYEKEAPYRVLVVDDEARIVHLITQMLKSSNLNIEVKSTLSGLESLIISGQFNPNLVILDVHLTEIEGEQVLASLKDSMPGNSGKVLLMSGDVESLKELGEQGADDYLVKPFSSNDLIRKVVTLLGIERRKR
ncbi:ATP-binding protein [Verrucomicrobiota bacterium]